MTPPIYCVDQAAFIPADHKCPSCDCGQAKSDTREATELKRLTVVCKECADLIEALLVACGLLSLNPAFEKRCRSAIDAARSQPTRGEG